MQKLKRLAALIVAAVMIGTLIPVLSEGALTFVDPPELIRPGKAIRLSFDAAQPGKASLVLKDAAGTVVATLYEQYDAKSGRNNLSWDGTVNGQPVSGGEYTLVLEINGAAAQTPVTVGALSPVLNHVAPSDPHIAPGSSWYMHVDASMAGKLTMALEQDTGDALLYEGNVPPGETDIPWNGVVNGTALVPGDYTLILQLTDDTGFSSNAQYVSINVEEANADSQQALQQGTGEPLANDDATVPQNDGGAVSPADFSPYPAGQELNYWTLPMDITDEAAVWEVLMQPMTVLKGEQKLAFKLRAEPDENASAVGEVTYDSQGVRVLETLDNGWSLVEAYSSSFHGSSVEVWAQMVQGYVKTNLLQTKKPSSKYGVVLDKLTQRMYVFSDGKLFTELLISTGLQNERQPYNETQAGEYLIVSRVGQFKSDNLICDMALRFNNGNLIHQVPYTLNADGSKYFNKTEPKLGTKASHGCVRVQRKRNPQGVNMAWLWENLDLNTKVLIWEDYKGRQISIPSADTTLYYNPEGGQYYHSVENCPDVKEKFLPLAGFTYGQLGTAPFDSLTRCPACAPPMRESELQAINAAYQAE